MHISSVAASDAGVDVDDGHHSAADCDCRSTDRQHECRKLGPREQRSVFQLEVRGCWQDVSQWYGGHNTLVGRDGVEGRTLGFFFSFCAS